MLNEKDTKDINRSLDLIRLLVSVIGAILVYDQIRTRQVNKILEEADNISEQTVSPIDDLVVMVARTVWGLVSAFRFRSKPKETE